MATNRRAFIEHLSVALLPQRAVPIPRSAYAQSLSPAEARQIAEDAYIYGYSLITTEVTRVQGSNVSQAVPQKMSAPMNQFANVPKIHPRIFGVRPERRYALFVSLA